MLENGLVRWNKFTLFFLLPTPVRAATFHSLISYKILSTPLGVAVQPTVSQRLQTHSMKNEIFTTSGTLCCGVYQQSASKNWNFNFLFDANDGRGARVVARNGCTSLLKFDKNRVQVERGGMGDELDFFTCSHSRRESDSTGKLLLTSQYYSNTACEWEDRENIFFLLQQLFCVPSCSCWMSSHCAPTHASAEANYAKRTSEHERETGIIDYFIIVIFCCLQSLLSSPLTASSQRRVDARQWRIKDNFS